MNEIQHVLNLSYGDPKQGCEAAALELQKRALEFLSGLQATGAIHDVRAYISLTGNRFERTGLVIVEGSQGAIQDLFWNAEWKTQVAQARALLNHVTLELAVGGPPASLGGPAGVFADAVAGIDAQ